jgi:dipeptidase E
MSQQADRHVVAMSAGRATMERREDPIHQYVLDLSREARPRVAFLPTASGDDPSYIVAFYETYNAQRCVPSHLSLFYRQVRDVRAYLMSQDVIHVGGGNTANMLQVWRLHGLDGILREAWEAGIILCGGGAGAMCWFEGGLTSSFGISEPQPVFDGIALLAGSICPHYDIEPLRPPAYRELVSNGGLPDGYAVEDDTALHFVNGDLQATVSSRREGRAFGLRRSAKGVSESPLEVVYLDTAEDIAPWYKRRQ